jgi:hypothetical protein
VITRLGLGLSGFSQLLQESEHFDRWRLQLRTLLGKEKRPPEPIPATFVLSGSAGRSKKALEYLSVISRFLSFAREFMPSRF